MLVARAGLGQGNSNGWTVLRLRVRVCKKIVEGVVDKFREALPRLVRQVAQHPQESRRRSEVEL
ncbi:hypothetical protein AB0N19_33890, partial [Streptomyces sp. NPDC051132]|uniref:hypothetical protein n=1 Tax=Streptomyces sp. NPDC051132 TaxID=3155667 RepID=UPI00341F9457